MVHVTRIQQKRNIHSVPRKLRPKKSIEKQHEEKANHDLISSCNVVNTKHFKVLLLISNALFYVNNVFMFIHPLLFWHRLNSTKNSLFNVKIILALAQHKTELMQYSFLCEGSSGIHNKPIFVFVFIFDKIKMVLVENSVFESIILQHVHCAVCSALGVHIWYLVKLLIHDYSQREYKKHARR